MVTQTLNTLRRLLALGCYLFPVVPDGKEAWPGHSWPKVSTLQVAHVEEWIARHPESNWGVDAGKSGLVILDVDCKPGKPGKESLAELELIHGLPDTFTVRTPTGGLHLYMKGETGCRVNMLPGLDVRSVGGYVVAPGSRIAGVEYAIEKDIPVAKAPAWLPAMAGAPREIDPKNAEPVCEIDADRARENAVEYASLAAPAIEGQGGDTRTFVVACQLRDYGVAEDVCLDILLEHFNPRCEPPWDAEELARKVKHAYTYAKDRPGNESPEAKALEAADVFEGHAPAAAPAAPKPVVAQLRHYSDLGHTNPPREWVLRDWIPQGPSAFTLFSGDGGTGKSMVAIALGLAVAAGENWEGIETTEMPVLYVSCEDDEQEIDRRVFAHRVFPGRETQATFDRPFYVQSRQGLNSLLCVTHEGRIMKGPFYAELDLLLGKLPAGPKLLILDTLVDMFGGNENSRPEVNTFVKTVVGSLTIKHNATAILIAHPPKNTGSTYSGSTAWNGAVRNRIYLRHQDPKHRNKYRILSNEKANYGETGGELMLKWDRGIYTKVDQTEMEGLLESAVIVAIEQAQAAGAPLSLTPQSGTYIIRQKILDHEGNQIPPDSITTVVQNLLSKGVIKNITGKSRGNGLHLS